MEIDPGLKQEAPSPIIPESDQSGHDIGSTPPEGAGGQAVAMSISTLPSPEEGDALTLLPEVQATGRPVGTKRPFQRRRRSRACDACRARKTKVRVLSYVIAFYRFTYGHRF